MENSRKNCIKLLEELGILEGHQFKSRAYKNAARTLGNITDEDFNTCTNFMKYSGIGSSINSKILAFKETGVIEKLLNLRESNKSYLDPTLYKIRKGFITKRIPYKEATEICNTIFHGVDKKYLRSFVFCGSYRRKKEWIADIDVLCYGQDTYFELIQFCEKCGYELLVNGDRKTSFRIPNAENTQIDITICEANEYPFAVLHFTGSKEHNIKMRREALKHGLKLNQYGLFDSNGNLINCSTEKDIFKALGMPYVNPENR